MKRECIIFQVWNWFRGLMDRGTDPGLAEDGLWGRSSQSPPPEDRCQAFADDLEALRRGELSIDALWKRYDAASGADFGEILAFVQHWVADDDIRATDPKYRDMQESELDRLVSLLRAGRMAEAKGVTFLGR